MKSDLLWVDFMFVWMSAAQKNYNIISLSILFQILYTEIPASQAVVFITMFIEFKLKTKITFMKDSRGYVICIFQ